MNEKSIVDVRSSLDRRLWDFTYFIINHYDCNIEYKLIPRNDDTKKDGHLYFFIPRTYTDIQKIAKIIKQEWSYIEYKNSTIHGIYFPGMFLHICLYDGPQKYKFRQEINIENAKKAQLVRLAIKFDKFIKDSDIEPGTLVYIDKIQ